jgi:phage gpG-like protein
MPVEMKVDINDRRVRRLLTKIAARIRNTKPVMGVIGEIVQASIQRNFEVGGRPEKWKSLSRHTIARRAARNKWPGQILVVSGRLKAIVTQVFSDQVKISANQPQAAVMHFGAKKGSFGTVTARVAAHVRRLKSGKEVTVSAHTRMQKMPWGDIPSRKFMLVQEEDWKEMSAALGDFLLRL